MELGMAFKLSSSTKGEMRKAADLRVRHLNGFRPSIYIKSANQAARLNKMFDQISIDRTRGFAGADRSPFALKLSCLASSSHLNRRIARFFRTDGDESRGPSVEWTADAESVASDSHRGARTWRKCPEREWMDGGCLNSMLYPVYVFNSVIASEMDSGILSLRVVV